MQSVTTTAPSAVSYSVSRTRVPSRYWREPPPGREHEPRGVVDQHVLEHPGRERVAPDGQQPAREADSRLLEQGRGRQRERRYRARQGHEAAGTEDLVEGDSRAPCA